MELSKAKLSVSLLICTLKSDFEGGRKVLLQTLIFFFWLETQKKQLGLYYKPTFFRLETKNKIGVCRTTFLPSKSLIRVQIKRLSVCSEPEFRNCVNFLFKTKTSIFSLWECVQQIQQINSTYLPDTYVQLIQIHIINHKIFQKICRIYFVNISNTD